VRIAFRFSGGRMSRYASKAAADLAEQLGLGDVEIAGTGRDGAVTVEDVRTLIPEAPADLGEAGAALWQELAAELELRPDERRLLLAAARTLDEVGRMEAALAEADLVVAGSKGQSRPHPLIGEVRAHRLALRSLMASIGITDEGAGDRDAERSNAGRKLARQRWDHRRG